MGQWRWDTLEENLTGMGLMEERCELKCSFMVRLRNFKNNKRTFLVNILALPFRSLSNFFYGFCGIPMELPLNGFLSIWLAKEEPQEL